MNGILVNIRITASDSTEVALEVTNVDGIEAYDCDVETNVGLRDVVAYKVVLAFKYLLDIVQRLEDHLDGLLIRLLRARKPTFINTV